jgi:hypothetical protein
MKLLRECPVVGMDISSVETSCFIKGNLSFQQNVLIKYVLVPVVQNELPVLFYSVVDVSLVGCVNLQLNNNVSQNILSSSSELNVQNVRVAYTSGHKSICPYHSACSK